MQKTSVGPAEGGNTPSPLNEQKGILPFDLGLRSRPDYVQASGSYTFAKVVTLGASLTLDKNGIMYVGGSFGVGVPKGRGVSLTFNSLDYHDGPQTQLHDFLNGGSWNVAGGYYVGLIHTWSSDKNNKTTSSGWGVMTPQIGGGYGNNPPILQFSTNIKW